MTSGLGESRPYNPMPRLILDSESKKGATFLTFEAQTLQEDKYEEALGRHTEASSVDEEFGDVALQVQAALLVRADGRSLRLHNDGFINLNCQIIIGSNTVID